MPPYVRIALAITMEESDRVQELMRQGITQVSIFRRGLEEIEKDKIALSTNTPEQKKV